MRIAFFLTVLCTVTLAAVVKDPSVGPISPEKHPRTSLEESIRRMRLSIDRELVYLARMDEVKGSMNTEGMVARQEYPADGETDSTFGGFTDKVNDGASYFRPIRPGVEVPSAKMVEDSEPEPSDAPVDPPVVPPTEGPGNETDPPIEPVTPEPGQSDKPTETPDVPVTEQPTPVFPSPSALLPSASVAPSVTPNDMTPVVIPTETPMEGESPTPTDMETLTPEPSPLPSGVSPSPPVDETQTPEPTIPIPGILGVDSSPSPEETFAEVIVSPTGEEDDGPVCFPAHATVQLEDGAIKQMSQVELGDRVLVGNGQFSEVFMFTHKMASVRHSFVEILTSSGHRLPLTKGHYLYVNNKLAAAETVRKGDLLTLGNEELTTVQSVTMIISTGLYNPQTTNGNIVVNGVRASTYTMGVEPKVAHALLAPLRAVYDRVGFSLTAFETGADYIAGLVPSGSLVY